jgi:hypothetical protein
LEGELAELFNEKKPLKSRKSVSLRFLTCGSELLRESEYQVTISTKNLVLHIPSKFQFFGQPADLTATYRK